MRMVSTLGPPYYGGGSGLLEALSPWNSGEVALALDWIRWDVGIRYSAEANALEGR